MRIGLWNKRRKIKFSSGQGTNSNINKSGKTEIILNTLDNIVKEKLKIPTIINFDIEGAEIKAIQGSKKIIKKNEPDLAISVYHHPQHLWEVINLVFKYNKKYKFFLRNYTGFVSETVLYATIK